MRVGAARALLAGRRIGNLQEIVRDVVAARRIPRVRPEIGLMAQSVDYRNRQTPAVVAQVGDLAQVVRHGQGLPERFRLAVRGDLTAAKAVQLEKCYTKPI